MRKERVLGAILGVMGLLTVPIVLLNLLGGTVSGVWLLILGEWWALAYGLSLLVFSLLGLALAMLPGLLLTLPAAYFHSRGYRFPVYICALLTNLYPSALMTMWCVWVLSVYLERADKRSFLPLLLWSYATATGPWTYLASKDRNSPASIIAATAAQIGYIVMMLLAVFSKATLMDLATAFGMVMLLALLLQFAVAILTGPERRKAPV